MIVGLPGLVGSHGFPAAGTRLSSVCSGPSSHDSGNSNYYDSQGTNFNGMFTLWQQFADGAGGSYWTSYGDNSNDGHTACWYPVNFYVYFSGSDQGFDWYGCGTSGHFVYGSYSSFSYWNGDGTTTDYSGTSYYYSAGYLIFDSGCCQVYYDGSSGYYVSDNCGGGCPDAGQIISNGCNATDGYDAAGNYWQGSWNYGSFYTDGSCGQYFQFEQTNYNGCWLPAGYWMSYQNTPGVLTWYVYDTDGSGTQIGSGDFAFSSNYDGYQADGSGGSYYSSGGGNAAPGQEIANGTYFDNGGQATYYFFVYSDGYSGYYVNQGIQ